MLKSSSNNYHGWFCQRQRSNIRTHKHIALYFELLLLLLRDLFLFVFFLSSSFTCISRSDGSSNCSTIIFLSLSFCPSSSFFPPSPPPYSQVCTDTTVEPTINFCVLSLLVGERTHVRLFSLSCARALLTWACSISLQLQGNNTWKKH